jgi:hypothetical protein
MNIERRQLHHPRVRQAGGAAVGFVEGPSLLADILWLGFPVFLGSYMYFGHHASAMAAVGWGFASALGVGIGALLLGIPGMLAAGAGATYLALTSSKKVSS